MMKKRSTKRRAVALGGIAAFGVGSITLAQVPPADLTGIWEGFQTCEGFDDLGAFRTGRLDDFLLISQNGTDLNVYSVGFDVFYNGEMVFDPNQPDKVAQATIIDCETDPENNDFFGEIGRWTKANLKPAGSGTIRGKSILGGADEGFPFTETCNWTYRRIDTEDLGVPDCAEIGGLGTSALSEQFPEVERQSRGR